MNSINIPIISSLSPDKAFGAGKSAATVLPLSVGQIVEAIVVEKAGHSRFVLTAKDYSFLANSDLPLGKGERLIVRVEQLNPQIILRAVNRQEVSSLIISEYKSTYRSNPDALREMFTMGRDVLNQKSLMDLLPGKAKEYIGNILKLMDASVFSPSSLKNPLFVKDYVSNLGLLLEYNLRKTVQEKGERGNPRSGETLKGLLMKLSEELRPQLGGDGIAGKEDVQKVAQLAKFTEASIKTIECQQMINVSYKTNDANYVLQIPILFPEEIKTGDLFIETEKDGGGGNAGKRYHVVMFLDMDALGEMMVDVSLAGNKLGCVFKFDDPEAKEFFSAFLGDLENAVSLLGYECNFLNCVSLETLKETREYYHRELFSDRDAVNVFV
jgi:hypothetical protein